MATKLKRLYRNLKPTEYVLELTTDPDSMSFTGKVLIKFDKTGRPSQRLTFHQYGLKISSAKIIKHQKNSSQQIAVIRINNQNTLNEVRIHSDQLIYSGKYEVELHFSGQITRGMTGLYPCFFSHQNKEHIILATQFESHHAREVFPCIDEPEAKASFQLSLTTKSNLQVLSNTPIDNQRVEGSLMTTTFATTPRMSTYLLAFVVGELNHVSTKTKRGTEVSVWASLAQPNSFLSYGLDIAKKSIEFFENYFGVNYPLVKADHVALPDFSSGAMENWGLITYRERVLLTNPENSSQSTKEIIATVIAHETSHQWFGNLVTMRWWDDLWLNESFANLMEYQAVDSLFPEWHIWDSFVSQEALSAIRRDAMGGVQAVKTNVHHPDEIGTLFDPSIVYAKGGRLLNMLKTYIGEAAFRQGLMHYFQTFGYGNTTGSDLWQSLSISSGINVAEFMDPWLERSGFPMLSVDQTADKITLSQAHFQENGPVEDRILWPIPLFSNITELPKLLDKASLSNASVAHDHAAIFNQGANGHYIVNYRQDAHRSSIIKLVSQHSLATADRIMLLNDASMLAKAGQRSYSDVLKLLAAYQGEDRDAVWDMMTVIIGELKRFIDYDKDLEPGIKLFVRQLIQPQYQRLKWTSTSDELPSDRKLRATIISLGIYSEDPSITSKALKEFHDHVKHPDSINAEIRSIIFSAAIITNSDNAFDSLLNIYDQTSSSDLKSDIIAALTSTRSPQKAKILLDRLKVSELIKPQDVEFWLVNLLRNRYTRHISWDWLVSNWKWIEDTYTHDKSYDNYPRYTASICNTSAWAENYRLFFEPKQKQVALRRNIEIGLEEINNRINWLKRDLDSVQHFFRIPSPINLKPNNAKKV